MALEKLDYAYVSGNGYVALKEKSRDLKNELVMLKMLLCKNAKGYSPR